MAQLGIWLVNSIFFLFLLEEEHHIHIIVFMLLSTGCVASTNTEKTILTRNSQMDSGEVQKENVTCASEYKNQKIFVY